MQHCSYLGCPSTKKERKFLDSKPFKGQSLEATFQRRIGFFCTISILAYAGPRRSAEKNACVGSSCFEVKESMLWPVLVIAQPFSKRNLQRGNTKPSMKIGREMQSVGTLLPIYRLWSNHCL